MSANKQNRHIAPSNVTAFPAGGATTPNGRENHPQTSAAPMYEQYGRQQAVPTHHGQHSHLQGAVDPMNAHCACQQAIAVPNVQSAVPHHGQYGYP